MGVVDDMPAIAATLDQIPARIRALRERRDKSLADIAALTGISKSTLSRLESGQRRPSLELLLPVAAALAVPLDEIVGAPRVVDPRVPQRPARSGGRVIVSLSRTQGEPKAYKLTIPAHENTPRLRTHTGYEWLYVLSGTLRLVLADCDVELGPGEVAEFDTRHPHWFGSTGSGPVEVLSLFGKQGERIHVRTRARPRPRTGPADPPDPGEER